MRKSSRGYRERSKSPKGFKRIKYSHFSKYSSKEKYYFDEERTSGKIV